MKKQVPSATFEVAAQKEKESNRKNTATHQKYLLSYLENMGFSTLEHYRAERQLLLAKFTNQKNIEISTEFNPIPSIKVVSHLPNYEFITLQVAMGHFVLKNVILANFEDQSASHRMHENFSGNFCAVYKAKYDGEYYAFKCFELPNAQQAEEETEEQKEKEKNGKVKPTREMVFKGAILEYCRTLIASYLEIGPKVKRSLVYDVAVYENCVEFAKEFCLQGQQIPSYVDFASSVKQALKIAHFSRFFHFDIKPPNVCYSRVRRKIVFIDFGFSSFLDAELGEMTQMGFKGSLVFCSKEMAAVFNTGKPAFVDPYFNDLNGLIKTIEQRQAQIEAQDDDEEFPQRRRQREVQQLMLCDITKDLFLKTFKCTLYQLNLKSIFQLASPKHKHFKLIAKQKMKIVEFLQNFGDFYIFSDIEKSFNQNHKYDETAPERKRKHHFPTWKKQQNQNSSDFQERINFKEVFDTLALFSAFQHNCKSWQRGFKSQEESLLGANTIKQLPTDSYFVTLAQALQINTNQYSFQQRKKFASVALTLLQQKVNQSQSSGLLTLHSSTQACDQGMLCLKKVSRLLLDYSLSQPHSRAKLKVFEATLINFIVLRAGSPQQIFQYFKKVHELSVDSQTKLRMVVSFMFTLDWLWFTIKSKANLFQHLDKYRQFSSSYIHGLTTEKFCINFMHVYQTLSQIFFFQNGEDLTQQIAQELQNCGKFSLKFHDQATKSLLAKIIPYLKIKNYWLQDFQQFEVNIFKAKFQNFQQFEPIHFALSHLYYSNKLSRSGISLTDLFYGIFGETGLHQEYFLYSYRVLSDYLQKGVSNYSPQHLIQEIQPIIPQTSILKFSMNNMIQQSLAVPQSLFSSFQFYFSLKFYQYQGNFKKQKDFLIKILQFTYSLQVKKLILSCIQKSTPGQKNYFQKEQVNLQVQRQKVFYAETRKYFKNNKSNWSKKDQAVTFLPILQQLAYVLSFSKKDKQCQQLVSIRIRLCSILKLKLFQKTILIRRFPKIQIFFDCSDQNNQPFYANNAILHNILKQYKLFHYYFDGFEELLVHVFWIFSKKHYNQDLFFEFLQAISKLINDNQFKYKDKKNVQNLASICNYIFRQKTDFDKVVSVLKILFTRVEKCPSLAFFIKCFHNIFNNELNQSQYLKIFKSLRFLNGSLRSFVLYGVILSFVEKFNSKLPARKKAFLLRKNLKVHQNIQQWPLRFCRFKEWVNLQRQKTKTLNRGKYIKLFKTSINKIKVAYPRLYPIAMFL